MRTSSTCVISDKNEKKKGKIQLKNIFHFDELKNIYHFIKTLELAIVRGLTGTRKSFFFIYRFEFVTIVVVEK